MWSQLCTFSTYIAKYLRVTAKFSIFGSIQFVYGQGGSVKLHWFGMESR